jgi:hypothetical protein
MYISFYVLVTIAFLNSKLFECSFGQHELDAIYENEQNIELLPKIPLTVKEDSLRESDDDSEWNKKSPYTNFTCDEENLKKFFDGNLIQVLLFKPFILFFYLFLFILTKNRKKKIWLL